MGARKRTGIAGQRRSEQGTSAKRCACSSAGRLAITKVWRRLLRVSAPARTCAHPELSLSLSRARLEHARAARAHLGARRTSVGVVDELLESRLRAVLDDRARP
eukprot:3867338-Prymnesium_polylepis.1